VLQEQLIQAVAEVVDVQLLVKVMVAQVLVDQVLLLFHILMYMQTQYHKQTEHLVILVQAVYM
jgi:hypothetical protein